MLVAYAPARPEWGTVGAVRRSGIEAQLAGRALPAGSTLTRGALRKITTSWAIAAAAMAWGDGTAITGPPCRAHRVDESRVTLPAGFRSSRPSVPMSASHGAAV
ncbi:hypothetical protein ACGF4C_37585 [Streptomyces sp. NPDC048197]|uniref:hypothetical protein n=1 Tax=Streptomyces sp. NPDC048197 TaxID=3365511 RepID=UPI00371BBF94